MVSLRRFFGRHVGILLAPWIYIAFVLLLPVSQARLRAILPEHEARVVEFSPDGRVMVTDGNSGGCIRDVATGLVLSQLTRDDRTGTSRATNITWPRFTADGKRLIVQLGGPRFGRDLTVTLAVFEVATGRELASFERVGSNVWFGSSLPPPEYALSAEGSILAFTRMSDDRRGQVTVWDVEAEKAVAEFPGSAPLALTPDGSKIAYGDLRTDAVFPAIRTLRTRQFPGPNVADRAKSNAMSAGPVAFSRDGDWVAVVSKNDEPLVRKVSAIPETHESGDVPKLNTLAEPLADRSRPVSFLSPKATWFSHDSRLLFAEDLGGYTETPSIQVWDISGPTPLPILQGPAEGIAPDARRMVTAHYDHISRWNPDARDNSVVKLFDLPSSLPRLLFKETGVHTATISPDGKMLAMPSSRNESVGSAGFMSFLDPMFRFIGISPNWLIGNSSSVAIRDIRLHDAATGQFVEAIHCRKDAPTLPLVEFSPDSKSLIVKYHPAHFAWDSRNPLVDWSVELWDLPDRRPPGWFLRPSGATTAALLIFAGVVFDWRRKPRPHILPH